MSAHIHRLLSIVETLSTCDSGCEIVEIARVCKVSDKTIRRDLNCLKKMGCRLEATTSGKGKKHYKLASGPNLALSLSFDEALAIFIGCHTSTAYRSAGLGQAAESSLSKLRQALGPLELDYLERHLSKFHRSQVGGDYARHSQMLDDLQLAIEDQIVLKVTYRSADRETALRYELHPYGLVEHRGTLYIVGYSSHRRAIRTWKLDRLSSTELTGKKFQRPPDFDLSAHFETAFAIIIGQQPQTIKVRFAPSAARYVLEKKMHASQQNEKLPDGTLIAQFELSSLLEIKSWILSFGAQAEVLGPPELRADIAQEAQRLAATYQGHANTTEGKPQGVDSLEVTSLKAQSLQAQRRPRRRTPK